MRSPSGVRGAAGYAHAGDDDVDGGDQPWPVGPRLRLASDWFDRALQRELRARGWPPLHDSQAQLLARLPAFGVHPTTVACWTGRSRQAVHKLLQSLVEVDLIALDPIPGDRRSRIVRLTPRGVALVADARRILVDLEAELADRIGRERVAALRAALSCDWGPAAGR